jgi:hypothetical protein
VQGCRRLTRRAMRLWNAVSQGCPILTLHSDIDSITKYAGARSCQRLYLPETKVTAGVGVGTGARWRLRRTPPTQVPHLRLGSGISKWRSIVCMCDAVRMRTKLSALDKMYRYRIRWGSDISSKKAVEILVQ